MRVNAARERLERMLPSAGTVLEAFLDRKHKVKCPKCDEWVEVKLPSEGALRAALAVFDRTGIGKHQTVHSESPKPTSAPEQLQGVMMELLSWPHEDLKLLNQAISQELGKVYELPASSLTSVDGESPEVEPTLPSSS